MNNKEIKNYLETIKKEGIKKGYVTFTYYTKGNQNNWYCDYYYYDYNNYFKGTTKATGYGYDKRSTSLSNAINLFKDYFTRYNKNAKKYTRYGLYEDNSISYGIGVGAVRGCVKCFKNVKIKNIYEGKYESSLSIEIDFSKLNKGVK